MSAPGAPLRTFGELCAFLRLGKDTVRKHLNSTDPQQYWPHLRIGREYRFTEQQWDAILAKQQARGPGEPETVGVSAAEFERSLARRRRDTQAA